ncbi:MAG: hypothetical protein PF489_16435 [Salinivirgaceae bacterium]|jgi:hypothetical protein|nr:hypothetical protein [Salinivirgaceae bacterium]
MMNESQLIKYLKNDLEELTDILGSIDPGQTLSAMEVRLMQSRVRSLYEEFEMLQDTLGQKTTDSIPKTEEKRRKKTVVDSSAKQNANKTHEVVADSEDITENEVEQPKEESRQVKEEQPDLKNEENAAHADEQVVEKPLAEPEEQEAFDTSIAEQQAADAAPVDDQWQPENEPEEAILDTNGRIIADKFDASSSLNDRMAAHFAQKDLASKLQQHPIADLTKSIKLNDKVWFIKELFGGNADDYKEAVNVVNNMQDMDEALNFLEQHYVFDQEKESFKNFMELIYRRFLK